jgi:hypothetical protein
VIRPEIQTALDRLRFLPIDIEPVFVTAVSLTGDKDLGEGPPEGLPLPKF